MRLPAEFPEAELTVLVDNREKKPFDLAPLRTETASLQTGDYTVKGMESLIAIERKSLPDLVNCCGSDRERFKREIERLAAFPHRLLAVEADWETICAGGWRSNVVPDSVTGSLLKWAADGLPFLCLPRKRLIHEVKRWLVGNARRRWRDLRTMALELTEVGA